MLSQPTFLYVEDDQFSREIMQMMMDGLGYKKLTIFEDSTDLLMRVEALSCPPDVFFLDVQIQPHDGFAMLKMLRDHPLYTKRKMVALTASVMNEEIARLKREGFDGAIGKPLDFENFAGLIERVLKGETVWHIV